MSPPVASVAKGREAARRDARRRTLARRRKRRSLFLLVAAVAALLVVVLSMPLFKEAVNELTLPLADQDIIRQQASEKHLDPALIAGVIYAETKFNARQSPAGAEGLMQILPETAEYLAHKSGATTFTTADLATPQVNIAYGSYYLRYLLDHYDQNTVFALAAYNGEIANVDKWVADAKSAGHTLTIDQIPFPETRAYVQRVLTAQHDYRHTYASQLGYRG